MRWSKKVRKNLLRLFSISFSFFLWLYVLSSAQTQIDKSVKVHYIVPEHMAIANSVAKEVHYTLSGPRAFVRSILSREDHIKVNLNDYYEPGQRSYKINIKNIGMTFPFGIEVLKVEPSFFIIHLENKASKVVPVKIQTVGEVPSDHKMIKFSVEPAMLKIEGPIAALRKVFEIKTHPIELNGMIKSGTKKVALYQLDETISVAQREVKYSYNIKTTRANLILKKIPIRFMSTRIIQGANRRFVNLMVLADKGLDFEFNKNDIKVIAEVPGDSKGRVKVELSANLPDGVHLLEIRPKHIYVNLKK